MIAAQVLRGLAHLNHPEHKVIHYDLKPANCLFDAFGQVKITVRALPAQKDRPSEHTPFALAFVVCCYPRPTLGTS